MPSPSESISCPLCASRQLHDFDRLKGSDIRTLWRSIGKEFPPEALPGIEAESNITLWRCGGCGFEFFDPRLAGNSLFYQTLESSEYYSLHRPEFFRTIQFAKDRKLVNVLDVGCGAGGFLDLARTAGLKTFGLELNPTAAEKARLKGHSIFKVLLHDLPVDACPGGFDLITIFQVLEHVSNPVEFVNQAAAHLKPQGFISIAVPARKGVLHLMRLDPSQWPPHHVSHWQLNDFKTLAHRTGLRLVESGGDPLLGARLEQAIRLQYQFASVLAGQPRRDERAWPGWLSWVYRKSGMKHFFPHWGDSVYVHLQKV